jgi:hypothetical protein
VNRRRRRIAKRRRRDRRERERWEHEGVYFDEHPALDDRHDDGDTGLWMITFDDPIVSA